MDASRSGRLVEVWPGQAAPLGAHWDGTGTNFALWSAGASAVDLCLFDPDGSEHRQRLQETTHQVWHGRLPGIGPGQRYGYRVHGPYDPASGARYNPAKLLLDPYARAVDGELVLDDALFASDPRDPSAADPADSAPFVPRGVVIHDSFPWGGDTLLQLASAQMHPTRGSVTILGETLGAVDVFELRPRIGLTSAALAQRISPSERVGDIVVSAGYAVVGRWRERYDVHDLTRAAVLMQQWGVARMAHRPFGTLSEGERKRTQIARALMTDPELLLLDEPGAGLDLGGREDLVTRLSDLAQDSYAPAQVLVTHHVEEIPPAYTHALLLRGGEVVAAGPADEVPVPDDRPVTTLGPPSGRPPVRASAGARTSPRGWLR